MIPRYLACTDYGQFCSHSNTVTPLFLLLVMAGIVAAICLKAGWDALGRRAEKREREERHPQPGGRTCCDTPAPGPHAGTCPNSVMMCGEERWLATEVPGSAPGHD